MTARDIAPLLGFKIDDEALKAAVIELKYEGYLKKEMSAVNEQKRLEGKLIPEDFDYGAIKALRIEAMQKLSEIRPLNLGQASRISGVSPADIAVLIVALQKNKGYILNIFNIFYRENIFLGGIYDYCRLFLRKFFTNFKIAPFSGI